uniref:C2H2-type domain-containing protein n=1 Tax=Iconisemion striatum TaxID=60296 RepID=A0A1A7X6F2_9TELE
MSAMEQLRRLVSERLAATAEEIFGLVEKTVVDYQEEVVRSRSEIIQLRQQIEQLTVLQPRVFLFKEDHSQPPADEKKETQQVKEEQLDVCIIPDLDSDSSEDVKFTRQDSETVSQTDSQLLPCDNSITVTLNEDFDSMRIGNPGSGSSSSGQNPHRAVSSRLRSVCCYMCDVAFLRECHLVEHMNTSHPGHKAFQCNECHKEFNRKHHLTLHLRVHTGEKPYICPFCGRSFTQNSSLTVHLRRHTGEKPYHCDTCGKMVSHSKHLKLCLFRSKVTTGTTEKPFWCGKCGKTFRSISELNMHINIHKANQVNSSK